MSKKYKKKPITIEAWQFTKDNYRRGVPEFIRNSSCVTLFSQYGGETIGGNIALNGIIIILENDYIIKKTTGEFYACRPDIFKMTYELA